MNEKQTTEKPDNPGVVAPPPLIYAAASALGLGLHAVFPLALLPAWAPAAAGPIVGSALLVGAGLLAFLALREMRRAGTNSNPDRPATALVDSGPFRLSRNPIYVALALLLAGVGVLTNALWVLVLLAPTLAVVDRGVIRREERYLRSKFGEEYARYRARVRRWI